MRPRFIYKKQIIVISFYGYLMATTGKLQFAALFVSAVALAAAAAAAQATR
jgi:hypothetical protein